MLFILKYSTSNQMMKRPARVQSVHSGTQHLNFAQVNLCLHIGYYCILRLFLVGCAAVAYFRMLVLGTVLWFIP